ncbi:YfiR family protein [Pandoraea anhela]|nr:YfiR family protein [Pandoraea anhela]
MTRGLRRECRAVLHWRARLLLCLLMLSLAALSDAMAQTSTGVGAGGAAPPSSSPSSASPSAAAREAHVRQVVLGIVSFTRWPTPPAKVRLCVVGNTDYARDLLAPQPAGQPSGNAPLVDAQRLSVTEPDIGSLCDALYLGAVSDTERRQLLASLAGHPVLTISERNDSCTLGAMFCLNVDADRVTFDINLDTVARSGVRVHPNVLKLARKPGTP